MSAFVPFGQQRLASHADTRECDIVAVSRSMQRVMALIARAAPHDTSVLIVGESGTGKELLAQTLHRRSPRSKGPFVAVNCSAIPDSLLESELFGHKRGAFTDAHDDQVGLLQSAHRGTAFLDEIGDMAPALQAKLLRALQEKEVRPLGAPASVPIDFRIVTATHRDPLRATPYPPPVDSLMSNASTFDARYGRRRATKPRPRAPSASIEKRYTGKFDSITSRLSDGQSPEDPHVLMGTPA